MGTGYDKSVDWWALGTLLYEMLSGLPPFFSEDLEEMNARILTEQLSFPKYFSMEVRSLLKGVCNTNKYQTNSLLVIG
jgi:serum/glucocorticoid-regulated kinase 2